MQLDALAGEVLDRRLLRHHQRPVAVALSGGGDSVALLLMAAAWAKTAGRPLLALTIDHGLNPAGRAWTQACSALATRMGAEFRRLAWTGDKPTTGLPAAAREARHRLLAGAARDTGARVILIGHTADDIAEARTMRATGSTTPEPTEWSPSPAWPEGRGIFLLRPLLAAGRTTIRQWLAARGEAWIDDPANADLRFARARARRTPVMTEASPPIASIADLAERTTGDADAGLGLTRLAAGDRRLLGMATVCAGGGGRRPATERLVRAANRIAAGEDFKASLAGARIEAAGDTVRLFREAGEARRGGLQPLALTPGLTRVWDGRYEVSASEPGLEVRAMAGLVQRLPADQQRQLSAYAPAARLTLPILVGDAATCPLLADTPGVTIRALVHERLLAAAGAIWREPA